MVVIPAVVVPEVFVVPGVVADASEVIVLCVIDGVVEAVVEVLFKLEDAATGAVAKGRLGSWPGNVIFGIANPLVEQSTTYAISFNMIGWWAQSLHRQTYNLQFAAPGYNHPCLWPDQRM